MGSYFIGATRASTHVELRGVTDVELELFDGAPLTGRVVGDADGRPIAGALVVASERGEAPEAEKQSVQTDGLGRFAFAALPRGDLALEVSAAGWAPDTVEAKTPGPIDVRLSSACRVDGVVVDGEGASVGGARESDPATLAGPNGRFWLELECDRAHTLIARDAAGRVGVGKLEPGAKRVTLRLEAGLTVPGVVRGAEGLPVPGADVAAMLDDEVRARAVSDERGTFTLSGLTPGNYVMRARKGRGASATVYGFEVPATSPLELSLEPGAAVKGQVTGGDDPITVELSWGTLRHERPARAQTLGGAFELDDLPAGAATVRASTPDGRFADARLFLAAGQTQVVNLALRRSGRILGRVVGPDAAGAQVYALRETDPVPLKSVVTDAEGAFVLEVPAGDYMLGAMHGTSHLRRFDAQVNVDEGRDARVTLTMLAADAGEGWGPMASVARGEIGGSFEVVNGTVQVSWVVADSPLAAAGVQVGDELTAVDGKPVGSALDAFARTRGTPGVDVALTVRRQGNERTLKIARAR
ncbi:MAG: carboxypeptidase regulatory-like domain-containing protein [Archangiaceae bacterium]|nr:carboxypeptidase regulatory-like domain-containing protein [Archangiaceae bacterium]